MQERNRGRKSNYDRVLIINLMGRTKKTNFRVIKYESANRGNKTFKKLIIIGTAEAEDKTKR